VYAAGFALSGKTELFYIEQNESSEQLVNRFFNCILNNNKLNNYTIYAHNLGRFDSLFIIKSLILNKNIKITPVWKDNSILSLTINYFDTKFTILDSIQLIPGSLDSILNSFNSNIKKGYFPYNFVNKNNLYYTGNKPSKEFYNNISVKDYLTIPENNWDLKFETFNYLRSDVEGLLDVIIKFNKNIVNKYDMNSQYPKAMLNDMPIGEPVLSLEKDLNKIFGFVYAEITCPNESELQVPFIQAKDSVFSFNICPRGKFKRLIFSEEAKYALKYGYKINVEYSYLFKKSKDLFTDYVNDHYKDKKLSKDPVQRNIAKLILNYLYGRLGMNETSDTLVIVDKESMINLDKNTYVSIISELGNNKYIVKYSGLIDESITDLYLNEVSLLELNKT
jgi:hypothetical protein